ncbi:DegT/DnrJ/EryC1/StrS family aminotransferase [Candidatus Amarolinea dominans]|uniref:DegT/DnrJ/EryC1/StrS family aminotransferase n=1 Tax=Candidatus Amarolinea dominans TaxID=3140696 RepID=UPI0031CC5D7C
MAWPAPTARWPAPGAGDAGVGAGRWVIIPTFPMIATANAVTYCGARPVLVDSSHAPGTWTSTRCGGSHHPRSAIMPVHTYGHPVDMGALRAIADRHGLLLLEDAAEAHGALQRAAGGQPGRRRLFQLLRQQDHHHRRRGMVTTNNEGIARLAWNLRDHAFSHERHFWHKVVGFNYRMTNLQAAIGLAQTEQLEKFVGMRRANAAYYSQLLAAIPGITTPPEADWAMNVYWMYGILVDEKVYGLNRDQLRKALADRGIETRTFFIPMHCQPVYFDQYRGQRFPVAEDLCRRGFYLPSASSLTRAEIERVVKTIREVRET